MRAFPRVLLICAMGAVTASCLPARGGVPGMLPRSGWEASPPVGEMRRHRIERITIHHTATRQRADRLLHEKMRGLQTFSQNEGALASGGTKPPWPDVPYHFYVDFMGRVAEGRDVRFAGDSNTAYDPAGHLLIVLEGNFEEEQPTSAQMATLRGMLVDLADRYDVPPERIEGHKDHAQTLCPGRHLYERIPELRAVVAGGGE